MDDIEELANDTLEGYVDRITYLYQTNNEYQHPLIGNSYVHEFPHWGTSGQSWHVDEETGNDRSDLPVGIVAEYATLARNMGSRDNSI